MNVCRRWQASFGRQVILGGGLPAKQVCRRWKLVRGVFAHHAIHLGSGPGAPVSSRWFDRLAQERQAGAMDPRKRGWLIDIVAGGVIGGVAGAIVAVNFVIYVGIEDGYEASIPDVFRQNVVAGIVTVAILLGGPVLGIVGARRRRGRRGRPGEG